MKGGAGARIFGILSCIVTFSSKINAQSWTTDDLGLFDLVEEVDSNFYALLGLKQDASTAEIKRAYRKLSLVYHPDRSKDPDAPEQFRKLAAVHEILKDETMRQKYNDVLEFGLPDWRQPIFYYRKARKMPWWELILIVILIVTVTQYLMLWGAYFEKLLTVQSKIDRIKKKEKQHKKNNLDIDDLISECLKENSVDKPTWTQLLPCTFLSFSFYIIRELPSLIVSSINRVFHKKGEVSEEEEEESQESIDYRLKKAPLYIAPVSYGLATDLKPVSTSTPTANGSLDSEWRGEEGPKSVEWSVEETAQLIRLTTSKYPTGTPNRWEKIASVLRRKPEDITAMVGKLKHMDPQDYQKLSALANSAQWVKSACPESIPSRAAETGTPEVDEPWSQSQQKLLEKALQQFPKGAPERWENISRCVPGKSQVSDLLGENNRLLQGSGEVEAEYQTQIRGLKDQLGDMEGRLELSEKAQTDLLALMKEQKQESHDKLAMLEDYYASQAATGKKFIEEQMAEQVEEREGLLAEIERLRVLASKHLDVSSLASSQSMVDASTEPHPLPPPSQDLNEEMEELRDQNQHLKLVLESQKDEIEKLKVSSQEEVAIMKESREKLQFELDERNMELEQKHSELLSLRKHSDELTELLEWKKSEKEMMHKELEELMMESSDLKRRLDTLQSSKTLLKEAQRRIQTLEGDLTQLNAQIVIQTDKNRDLKSRLGKAESDLCIQKDEIIHLRAELSRGESLGDQDVRKALGEKEEEIGHLNAIIEQLEARMESVKDVHKALEAQKAAAEHAGLRLKDREASDEDLRKRQRDLEQVLDETLREKEQLSAKVIRLEEYSRELENDYTVFKENAEAQYLDVRRSYDETIERLYCQLEKTTTCSGKEGLSKSPGGERSVVRRLDMSCVWDALPEDLRGALSILKMESGQIAELVRELQNLSLSSPPSKDSLQQTHHSPSSLPFVTQELRQCIAAKEGNTGGALMKVVVEFLEKSLGTKESEDTKDQLRAQIEEFDRALRLCVSVTSQKDERSPDSKFKVVAALQLENSQLKQKVLKLSGNIEEIKSNNQGLEEASKAEREEGRKRIADLSRQLSLAKREAVSSLEDKNDMELRAQRLKEQLNNMRTQWSKAKEWAAEKERELAEERRRGDEMEALMVQKEEIAEMLHGAAAETIQEVNRALEEEEKRNRDLSNENAELFMALEEERRKAIHTLRRERDYLTETTSWKDDELRELRFHLETNLSRLRSMHKRAKRAESWRRDLIYQKEYLREFVVASYQATERKAKILLAQDFPTLLQVPKTKRLRGKRRFKAAVCALIAVQRMEKRVGKWAGTPPGSGLSPLPLSGYRGFPSGADGRDRNDNFLDEVPVRHPPRSST